VKPFCLSNRSTFQTQLAPLLGGADVTAEVLLSRTALQRKPMPPGGPGAKPLKAGGRKLVPRVAMTAPSSNLWQSGRPGAGAVPGQGGKRGTPAGAAAWGSPGADAQGGVGAPSEWGFQVGPGGDGTRGVTTLPDITTPGGKTRPSAIPYHNLGSRQENRTPPAGIQGMGQGPKSSSNLGPAGGTPRQPLVYGAAVSAAAPRHGRPAAGRPGTNQQPRTGTSPGKEGPRPAPPAGPPGAITTPRGGTAGMKTRPLGAESSGDLGGW
jgi:hypothetical protein